MAASKKASAPRPMKETRAEAAETVDQARTVFEFTVRGEVAGQLAIGNVPTIEKMAARRQTGWSWTDILGADGAGLSIENLTILVWLARRASGEPDLMWLTFHESWDHTVRLDEIGFAPLPVGQFDEDADPQP